MLGILYIHVKRILLVFLGSCGLSFGGVGFRAWDGVTGSRFRTLRLRIERLKLGIEGLPVQPLRDSSVMYLNETREASCRFFRSLYLDGMKTFT